MSDADAALIFLHIPKTGGSTFRKILKHHFSKTETATLDIPGVARFKALTVAQRRRYRLIQGHLYFGLHRSVPRRSTYITFLRRPAERALSFYYYARSTPDHYLHRALTAEHVDFKTLLSENLTTELCNDQTRMLAGDEWEDPQRAVTRKALERAKENLRSHFRVVGLLEEFDASLLLLHRVFGWCLRAYAKENVTKEKPLDAALDPETSRLIDEANSLDLELYDYAHNLFDEQCRAAGDSFAADLDHLRRSNGDQARSVSGFARLFSSFRSANGKFTTGHA